MKSFIECRMCDFNPDVTSLKQAARNRLWGQHMNEHATDLHVQLASYSEARVCFECWFADRFDGPHRPCYTVDCPCPCST